jgi:hypothetical protein
MVSKARLIVKDSLAVDRPLTHCCEGELCFFQDPEQSSLKPTNGSNGETGTTMKAVVEAVEWMKTNLRDVISDLNDILDLLKAAGKEKKATLKEVESIRATLRSLQKVELQPIHDTGEVELFRLPGVILSTEATSNPSSILKGLPSYRPRHEELWENKTVALTGSGVICGSRMNAN